MELLIIPPLTPTRPGGYDGEAVRLPYRETAIVRFHCSTIAWSSETASHVISQHLKFCRLNILDSVITKVYMYVYVYVRDFRFSLVISLQISIFTVTVFLALFPGLPMFFSCIVLKNKGRSGNEANYLSCST